jgi:hypothetical protein
MRRRLSSEMPFFPFQVPPARAHPKPMIMFVRDPPA